MICICRLYQRRRNARRLCRSRSSCMIQHDLSFGTSCAGKPRANSSRSRPPGLSCFRPCPLPLLFSPLLPQPLLHHHSTSLLLPSLERQGDEERHQTSQRCRRRWRPRAQGGGEANLGRHQGLHRWRRRRHLRRPCRSVHPRPSGSTSNHRALNVCMRGAKSSLYTQDTSDSSMPSFSPSSSTPSCRSFPNRSPLRSHQDATSNC